MWKEGEEFLFIWDENFRYQPVEVTLMTLNAMFEVAKSDGVRIWYAHNGGKYDVCFILNACVLMGVKAKGYIAAGRVVSLELTYRGTTIRLHDSMAVIPSGLKRVAEDFDLKSKKLLNEDDYSVDVRKWTEERLREGCKADCAVVIEALNVVETMLHHEGGELKPTFSSCAFSVLKSKTKLPDTRKWKGANQLARIAYMGGRVEVYKHRPSEILSEWDVNSSYPWSMSQPDLPWELKGVVFGNDATKVFESMSPCIVECSVDVPDCYLPVLPFRHPDGGMYFPTGRFRGFFTSDEIRYALETHTASITEVHSAIAYEASSPFTEFITEFYNRKQNGKGAVRNFYKLILNGCYGKFAQKPEKEVLRIMESSEEAFEFLMKSDNDTVRVLSNSDLRFLGVQQFNWGKHTHYALAAFITSRSRILLHKYLSSASGIAYTDTDSIHAACISGVSLSPFCNGNLGALKKEIDSMVGFYYAPKLYAMYPTNGEPKYASKGFPVDAKTFDAVIRGERVQVQRMQLAKKQIRGNNEVARVEDFKQWSGRSSKRQPVDSRDGDTIPWDVKQLLANKHLDAMSPIRKK